MVDVVWISYFNIFSVTYEILNSVTQKKNKTNDFFFFLRISVFDLKKTYFLVWNGEISCFLTRYF